VTYVTGQNRDEILAHRTLVSVALLLELNKFAVHETRNAKMNNLRILSVSVADSNS